MPHPSAPAPEDSTEPPCTGSVPEPGFAVKVALTPNQPTAATSPAIGGGGRDVENPAFAAFVRRIIRAHGRRIATGDVEGLRELLTLAADLDAATHAAVTGLRQAGYSWAEIAERTGTTRQAAHQRWGQPHPTDEDPGVDTYASTDTTGDRA